MKSDWDAIVHDIVKRVQLPGKNLQSGEHSRRGGVIMTKNEFMVRMHDVIVKENFIIKLYNEDIISATVYLPVIEGLVEEFDEIWTTYFTDDNPNCETLSKEEMNYVFGGNYYSWQKHVDGKSMLMKVKLDDGALLPNTDVGVCLKSPVDVLIPARGRGRIDTGVHVSIPKGTVGIIKTTSSLNAIGLQCEGVIDEGYTGEVSIILENHNYNRIIVDRGEMIAQLVVLPVIRPKIEFVDELKETEKRQRFREQWEMKPVEEQR